MSQEIKLHDRVRSIDFEGREDCYIEGEVIGFTDMEGCPRYEIRCDVDVFRGEHSRGRVGERFYPPVNGTPRSFGGITNGVTKLDPIQGHLVITKRPGEEPKLEHWPDLELWRHQRWVSGKPEGGLIDVALRGPRMDGWVCYCDDEGLLTQNPQVCFWRPTDGAPIAGPVVFLGSTQEGDDRGLTTAEAREVLALLYGIPASELPSEIVTRLEAVMA